MRNIILFRYLILAGIFISFRSFADDDQTHVLSKPLLVPITLFICGAVIASVAIYFRYREQSERQQTIRAMVEKNMPIPPELLVSRGGRGDFNYRRRPGKGIMLILVGAIITYKLYQDHDDSNWIWGLIPIAVGVSRLIAYQFTKETPPPSVDGK